MIIKRKSIFRRSNHLASNFYEIENDSISSNVVAFYSWNFNLDENEEVC